jgi:hypothetical protein
LRNRQYQGEEKGRGGGKKKQKQQIPPLPDREDKPPHTGDNLRFPQAFHNGLPD